jgi:PleD family two-component response regulator
MSGQGWEFLQLLKMRDQTAKILIIVTPTLQFSSELESYLRTRFIQFINKPLDFDTFLPLVQKTLALASQTGVLFSSDRVLPILVVEDQKDLREAVTTVLGFDGYPVVTADNGQQALDVVSTADYCLILLDIEMPVMNGFEFLLAYERQPRPHTPVIILSA